MTIAARRRWIRARNNLWLRIATLYLIGLAGWFAVDAIGRLIRSIF